MLRTTERLAMQIDFDKHWRRLARATGAELALVACNTAGESIWASDAAASEVFAQSGARLDPPAQLPGGPGSRTWRQDLPDAATMLCTPLAARHQPALGYLCVIGMRPDHVGAASSRQEHSTASARQDDKPDALTGDEATLARALETAAEAILDEHGLLCELDNLASELSDRYEELHLVYSMDARMKEFSRGPDVFRSLLDLCAQQLDVDLAAIVYPAKDMTVSASNLSKPMFNLDLVLVELRGNLYRFMHSGGQGVVINSATDPRRGYIFTHMPYKVLACPLMLDGAVLAILAFVNHDDKPDFQASDRKIAEVMANQLSNLLQMYRAFDSASRFTDQVVAALIETVEAKDPYTRGHSERVQAIALDVAREVGMAGDELDSLAWGALLHDVGKIGIPDAVLCKPGPLTEDEYTFVKVHAARGVEILRHIERLHHVLPGVQHHHERFDGRGYPAGIAGEAIPLASRVIAVADTYDAMTSSRAYRAGHSHEKAVAEIRRVAGTQLDPTVVAAFLRVCERDPAWIHVPADGPSVAHV